jgi:hypothetical protein
LADAQQVGLQRAAQVLKDPVDAFIKLSVVAATRPERCEFSFLSRLVANEQQRLASHEGDGLA